MNKGAHLNFATGAILHGYATGSKYQLNWFFQYFAGITGQWHRSVRKWQIWRFVLFVNWNCNECSHGCGTSPVSTGRLWWAYPPRTKIQPPKIEIWNTINQWSCCQILECQAPLHKRVKCPIEDFLTTVLCGTTPVTNSLLNKNNRIWREWSDKCWNIS